MTATNSDAGGAEAPQRPAPAMAKRTSLPAPLRRATGRVKGAVRRQLKSGWGGFARVLGAVTAQDQPHINPLPGGSCGPSPPTPRAHRDRKRGGARPQTPARAPPEGGAECRRVRPQPRGRKRREGALPRMPLERGLSRPASSAHHSRPCPARPRPFGR